MYSAAHGDLGPKRGSKLEGRLNGLDADMQQPATCRKVEVDLVRRVAPKLIANGESYALERGRPARGLRLGSHVAVKRAGMEGKEAYRTVVGGGARLRKGTRKNHSRERDKGTRMFAPGVPARGTIEEST